MLGCDSIMSVINEIKQGVPVLVQILVAVKVEPAPAVGWVIVDRNNNAANGGGWGSW